jgi:acid phosphatase family membrane protein YuiD
MPEGIESEANDFEAPMFARTAGMASSEEGLVHELKTTVDDELFAAFIVKARAAGGRARVLRDLVSMFVNDGLTYDEHVAKRRRELHFGKGQGIAQALALRVVGTAGDPK